MKSFNIVDVNWKNLMKEIKEIRFQVFVREQGVPPELEVDGSDPLCLHVLAEIPGKGFIGTARLLPDGHIGRVAVLAEYRRKGIGREMVLHLIQLARSLRPPSNAECPGISPGVLLPDGFHPRRRSVLRCRNPAFPDAHGSFCQRLTNHVSFIHAKRV